ncbi:MAG: asparagine synthase (glutamine-hydrolyzing) [Saccharopolyspora sp.]|uniref:asparagine synthase (glutamine-hydrolyzing) n=1 Tax=Saccharopolyspora sp. TaxID=33915 RepID=UPI0025F480F0|nr:asparagine synthase (glutamine-hydrolyzing) [Saccharopolyspora sp.]MBQ6639989.1 asparagine synthase (glutamine-hydrolyzing) [Saccharopolyspora sp.]
MCGIAGWVDWCRDLREQGRTIRSMTDTMRPRGPDAGEVWLSRRAALGHRRLAVIDLVGGAQPFPVRSQDGELLAVITYSGEVYNYQELRSELIMRGHRFRTESDTEVVVRSYLEWGEACVERLNGMFAFAVWDIPAQELLLARDRLGIKPLYYAVGDGYVLFGSEPKAILEHPSFTPRVGAEGVAELFAVPTAPTPGITPYLGMREVKPGHLVRYSRAGVDEQQYWRLESAEHQDDYDETVRAVRELIVDSVRRQLVSDVPIGMLLSGGLDSSVLTAFAAGTPGRGEDKLATFSVDFPDDEQPEQLGDWNNSGDAPYIADVVAGSGTAHTNVLVPGTELVQHRNLSLDARDWPGWGEPDVSVHLLFRGIREHVTVALSGEVADEVFGGYPFFKRTRFGPPETFPWMHGKQSPAALLRPDVAEAVRPEEYARERLGAALAEVPALSGEAGERRSAREITYLALTRWLPALLDRKDRMSMAASLEARVPFADHRLVEYLWNVPWDFKCRDGVPKQLLRDAVRDVIPDSVLNRPTSGYPARSAPAYRRALTSRVEDLLEKDAPVFDLVDRAKVKTMLQDGAVLPGPRAAPHPTGGLDYILAMNRWLGSCEVTLG